MPIFDTCVICIVACYVEHAVVNILRVDESPERAGVLQYRAKPSGICRRRCWKRGFSVVALSGELTENQRTRRGSRPGTPARALCVVT